MSIKVAFNYCQEKNLSEDKFVKSLSKSFKKYGSLTPKQEQCLINKVNNHKKIVRLLNEIDNDCEIVESLREFFNTRNFLTPKQLVMLEKYE